MRRFLDWIASILTNDKAFPIIAIVSVVVVVALPFVQHGCADLMVGNDGFPLDAPSSIPCPCGKRMRTENVDGRLGYRCPDCGRTYVRGGVK